MSEIIIQCIGWLGMAAFLISYQMRENRALFLMQVTGCALFCLQFMLMGAYTGCLSLVLNIFRGLLLSRSKTWKWVRGRGWAAVFCLLYTAVTLFTWAGPLSLLAWTASVVSTICCWTDNAGWIRLANLLCASPCWIVYDVIVGSWGGAASEALSMGSILISIRRFGFKNLFRK